jgi:putative DNA primase/helicase
LTAYLQRIAGLALTGCVNVEELFIFYGTGANGKSKFIDTLLHVLGPYAGTAPDTLLMSRNRDEHPTEVADLLGKRLVVASESDEGGRLRIQLVKKLTGDARIKARFMRQDFFEFQRTHKTILVTNHRPRVNENTEAVWRRIRIVPFGVTIPEAERDDGLLDKLIMEAPGVLAWAVRGCLDWQEHGMQPPAEVLVATDEYRSDADVFSDYVSERLILFSGARVTRKDLLTDYQAWAGKSPDRLDRNALYDRIRQLGGVAEGVTEGIRRFDGVGLCRSAQGEAGATW